MNRRYLQARVILVFLFYILFLGLLQANWPASAVIWGSKPDLTLILAILAGYMFGAADGILAGLAAGFFRDLLAGRALGLGMLLLMYAALLASSMFRRLFRRNILLGLVQILLISVMFESLLMLLTLIIPMLPDVHNSLNLVFRQFLARLPGQLLTNFLAGIPMIFLLHFLGPYRRGSHKDDPEDSIVGDSVWRVS